MTTRSNDEELKGAFETLALEPDASESYLSELADRVETIEDDMLGEKFRVDGQLINVNTANVACSFFRLGDIEDWDRQGGIIEWEEIPKDDLDDGDIIDKGDIVRCDGKICIFMGCSDDGDLIGLKLANGTMKGEKLDGQKVEKAVLQRRKSETRQQEAPSDVDVIAGLMLKSTEPILLVAGPGTGKTWFVQQLCFRLLSTIRKQPPTPETLLPVLVPVQKLARILRRDENATMKPSDIFSSFLETEHGFRYAPLLRKKFESGHLVILMDGVDEAAGEKETIESIIHDYIKPTGNRMIVTSRPEGVRLPLYIEHFDIMNLLPLDEEQQRNAITKFVEENEFLACLLKLSTIRSRHDEIYKGIRRKHLERIAQKKGIRRNDLERIAQKDSFKLENGNWDPAMRQKSRNGCDLAISNTRRSEFLKSTQQMFDESKILHRLEEELQSCVEAGEPLKQGDAKAIVDSVVRKREKSDEGDCVLCERLCLLRANIKKDKTTEQLWETIASRTDELYVSAEHFEPIYAKLLSTLEGECDGQINIQRATLKDPVRVFEKAENDYEKRFPDGLAESCVLDILRASLICSKAATMEKILDLLHTEKGLSLDYNGDTVGVALVRLKNFFRDDSLIPTHYRFMILVLQLSYGGAKFFVEIQLQHKEIKQFEKESDGHAAYEFFRSVLKDEYNKELPKMLHSQETESSLTRFESIAEVPVLLSLIITVLVNGGNDDPLGALLCSKYELYMKAMTCRVRRAVESNDETEVQKIMDMLTEVATANMRKQRRIFDWNDVRSATQESSESGFYEKWYELQSDSSTGIPLVKILSEFSRSGTNGEYQFKHQSFAEALYFHRLISGGSRLSAEESGRLLTDPFYRNTLSLGTEEDEFEKLTNVITVEDYFSLDEMTEESRENIQILKAIAKSDSFEHGSILGVLVGKGPPAVADQNVPSGVEYEFETVVEMPDGEIKKCVGGDGIVFDMVHGCLDKVRDFVATNGNIALDIEKAKTDRVSRANMRLDGCLILYEKVVDGVREQGGVQFDGISVPQTATNLLELAVASVRLEVARAIQEGLRARGEPCELGTERFFKLLQDAVHNHCAVKPFVAEGLKRVDERMRQKNEPI